MSLECRIFRDEKGQIDFVNAPNGNRSKLFDKLVDITGGNKNTALNIYALTEVEEFKDALDAKLNALKDRFKNIIKLAPADVTYSNVGKDFIDLNSLTEEDKKTLLDEYGKFFEVNNFDWNKESSRPDFQNWLEERDNLNLYKNLDLVIQKINEDIALKNKEAIAQKQLEDLEDLIIPSLGNSVLVPQVSKFVEDAILNPEATVESIQKAFEEAKNIIDEQGDIDISKIESRGLFNDAGISLPNFEKFVEENPDYKGVFEDWKKLFDKHTELMLTRTNAYRESTSINKMISLRDSLVNLKNNTKSLLSEVASEKINNKVSEYLNRINAIKEKEPSNYWSVDVPSEEVVRDAVVNDRLVEVPGGMGIVTEDGNMIGLFKDKADAKNVARDLQMMRVEKGGIKMDNYDGYLTKIYQKNGFRVVSRLAFNEEYAPQDWNKEKHGTPDVVFMIYDPNNALDIEEKSFTSDQYDEASDYRDSFIEEAKKIHPYYSNKLSENKTGKTQSFFSDVVRGDSEKYKAKKQWVPLLKYSAIQEAFNQLYSKFKCNFDNHIATSIPTFRETQVKVGNAISQMFSDNSKEKNSELLSVKDKYSKDKGIVTRPVYQKFDKGLFSKLAEYHSNVEDDRQNPAMKDSYEAFLKETLEQYQYLLDAGYKIEPWLGEGEPYGVDSNLLRKDIVENKHLYYLRSKSATGEGNENESAENYAPFRSTGIVLNGDDVLYNDLFRAVHDIFGHGMVANTFSTQGEYDAYNTHSPMYSDKAQKALFLETVVYNAYYYKNKKYAPRKIYDIPSEFLNYSDRLIYDIGGSEGGFVKAITEATGGKIKSINLDVNEDMQKAHNKIPVGNSEFVNEAFFEGYTDEDTGKTYKKHTPEKKADIVHESMVFQFITPERAQFIKEIKDNYLKEDGLVLLEEKLVPESDQEWLQNEYIKDQYKLQYYSQEEISGKAEEVLAGMRKNQTSVKDLQDALSSNFKYVEQYWDSGNFKGFVATNNLESLNKFRENFGENVVFKGEAPEAVKTERKPSIEVDGVKIFAKERVNPVTGEKLEGVEWELIESSDRGKGKARKAAEVFLQGTDAQGKDVYLTISPRDKTTSAEKLESFYSSLGFKKTSDFEMVRKAKPVSLKEVDSNGEPSIKTLMDFSNSKVKPLSEDGVKAAKNAAMALQVKNSKELIDKMEKALMKNGVVLFDKLSLQRSKLYNIFEINTIISSPRLQKQIKESLLSLRNSEPFEIEYDENFVVPQGREVNQFGKQEVMNPAVVEQELIESVAGLDESEIDEALPGAFSNKYYTNSDFRETVDRIARDYKKAPVKSIINGELVDKTEDVEGMLKNTVIQEQNDSISKDIMFLREEIDEDIFSSNLSAVSKVLNKIKKNAYINGIDLRNLPTLALELSRSELLGFLDSMEDVLSDPSNEENFKEFSERYYKILGDREVKTEVIKTDSENDVFVDKPLSEYEMFSKFGLVKKDENIYRQVTDEALETLYQNFFEYKDLLPDGVQTLDDLKNYVQSNASILGVSDYEVDVDNLEKMFLYKKFFGFPMATKKVRVNTDNFNKLTNSEEYLTGDFVKEFNKWILATSNPYFKVTKAGIELVNSDEISKAEAVDSVPERFKQELSEYNVISNNLNLDLPLPEEKYQDINTQLEQRQRAVNNPDRVKKVTGQYTYLKDGVLAVKNESETFVRTPIGVFEKIFEFENIKFYGKLDTDSKEGYKKVAIEAPFSNINFKDYMYLATTPEFFKTSKNYYSREELNDINDEYFGCQ